MIKRERKRGRNKGREERVEAEKRTLKSLTQDKATKRNFVYTYQPHTLDASK